MMHNKISTDRNSCIFRICILALCMLYTTFANAQDVTVSTMLENLNKYAVPNLMRLVTAFAYVLGMFFIYKGLLELKRFGESRSMMSHEHHLKTPLLYLIVGAALLYLPTSVQTGLTTFWATPNPYAYVIDKNDPWTELIHTCFMIIQLIGTIAFVRGLIMLAQLGHQQHQGGFGKAMTHIIGGIFCIDLYDFVTVVMNTLALGQP